MKGKNRRKKYLINPKFQLSMISYTFLISLLAAGVYYGANRYFFYKFNELGRLVGLPPEHVFFQFIAQQESTMNLIFAASTFAVGILIFSTGLFLSHRIAGPLYRLRMHMTEVAEGKHQKPVKLRDGDYFKELEDAHNKQLAYLTRNHQTKESA